LHRIIVLAGRRRIPNPVRKKAAKTEKQANQNEIFTVFHNEYTEIDLPLKASICIFCSISSVLGFWVFRFSGFQVFRFSGFQVLRL